MAGTGTCHNSFARDIPALLIPLPQSGGTCSSTNSCVLQHELTDAGQGDCQQHCAPATEILISPNELDSLHHTRGSYTRQHNYRSASRGNVCAGKFGSQPTYACTNCRIADISCPGAMVAYIFSSPPSPARPVFPGGLMLSDAGGPGSGNLQDWPSRQIMLAAVNSLRKSWVQAMKCCCRCYKYKCTIQINWA
jgi:hypothetical protein